MAPGLRRAVPLLVDAPLGPQLADGEELDDALLHLVEAGVVGVERWRGRRRRRARPSVRSVHGRPRTVSSQPWIQPALHVLLGHALEAAELLAQGADDVVGHAGGLEGVDAGAVVVDGLALGGVVAQLLADGVHLAAQEVLALLLVDAVADVVGDLLGQLPLGEGLLGPAEHEAHPLLDVDRLEQLDLAVGAQVGPPAGEVGEGAGVVGVDAAQDAAHLPVAEALEQRPAAWPAARRPGAAPPSDGLVVGDGLGRRPTGRRRCPTTPAPMRARPVARTTRAWVPPGQRAGGLDAGEDAHVGVAVADLGHEQELAAVVGGGRRGRLGLGGLEGDGHDHRRQDHAVGKGQDGKGVGLDRAGHHASEG